MVFGVFAITYGWYTENIPEIYVALLIVIVGVGAVAGGAEGRFPWIMIIGGGAVAAKHIYESVSG